jgi:hypothetical protein
MCFIDCVSANNVGQSLEICILYIVCLDRFRQSLVNVGYIDCVF